MLCLLFIFMSLSFACADGVKKEAGDTGVLGVSEQEALNIAETYVQRHGLIVPDVVVSSVRGSFKALLQDDPSWHVVYFAEGEPPPYLYIALDPSNGAVCEVEKSDYRAIRDKWEQVMGPAREWSLEDQVLFSELFFEDQRYGARVPGDNHISREEATSIACRALVESNKIDERELQFLEICYAFRNDVVEWGDGCGWLVSFYRKDNKGRAPDYQVNVSANNGAVVLVHLDPNSNG